MKLIVRVADYGMTDSITDGAICGIRKGIVTDVGMMTNNLKYAEYAAERIKEYTAISIGEDLNLVSGVPASNPSEIPDLVNEDGIFINSRQRKMPEYNVPIPYEEVYSEMKKQIERFIHLFGRKPAYLTGHSWSIPVVIKAMNELKNEYELTDCFMPELPIGERWYYKNCHVDPNDPKPAYGLQEQAETNVIAHIMDNELHFDFEKMEYAMLATHAGYCDGELMRMSSFSVIRGIELEALCSEEIRKWIVNNKIELINFNTYINDREE